ncbi:MAG: thioredoxin family protein [Luteolibacter sp.]
MPEVASTFRLQVGDRVPDFRLPDASGKLFSIGEVAGRRGLLLVFACNHCPYVIHLAAALGHLARDFADLGVGTVAINSNDAIAYPEDAAEKMPEFAAQYGWDFPYLVDTTQQVALDYGAACTPDFFLADSSMRLFYAGQFDETRPRDDKTPTGHSLREAVRCMTSGMPPIAKTAPSTGCSIKWKPGVQPSWWNTGIHP